MTASTVPPALAHRDHGGDGPPLVLLHAFPLDSGMWRRFVGPAGERWRVVTIDLPGLGASPTPTEPPSLDVAVDGVLAVLDRLGLDAITVFGVSTGGYVALRLAERSPDRLAGLVLGSTTTRVGPPDEPDGRRADADRIEAEHSTAVVADSAQEGLGETARREQPDLEHELADVIARGDPRGVAWMARAIADRHDTTAALAAFERPVVIVSGAEDTATPPSVAGQLRTAREPSPAPTTLQLLDATGHLTALEQPERTVACLDVLLDGRREPDAQPR